MAALQTAHDTFQKGGVDLKPLHEIFVQLLNEQMASVRGQPLVEATTPTP